MKAINADSAGERLKAISKFGKFFAGNLFDSYVKVFK